MEFRSCPNEDNDCTFDTSTDISDNSNQFLMVSPIDWEQGGGSGDSVAATDLLTNDITRSASSRQCQHPFHAANHQQLLLGEDEEILVLRKPRLEFLPPTPLLTGGHMEDLPEDFHICRRCRTLSYSLGSTPTNSYMRRQSTTKNRARTATSGASRLNRHVHDLRKPSMPELPSSVSAGRSEAVVDMLDDDVPLLNDAFDDDDHCHVHKSTAASARRAQRQLAISTVLCVLFMIAEIVGGYISNSLAIMTDAAHLLSDLTSFIISLFAIWVGQKAPTKKMSFGYYRAEVLGALVSVLIIWVLTAVLVYMAIERVRTQDYEIDSQMMLIVSGIGVAINIVMGVVLHGCCNMPHGHSHGGGGGHNHGHSHGGGEGDDNSQNINVRAALIHVLGDLLQSIGVLVAAYIIHYKPEYKLADPICTFIFSAIVLFTTLSILKDAINVLMEGIPPGLDYSEFKADLLSLPGVKTAHSLHIWCLTMDKNAMSVHLAVCPDTSSQKIVNAAQSLVRNKYLIYNTTIQVEKYDPEVMQACKTCKGP